MIHLCLLTNWFVFYSLSAFNSQYYSLLIAQNKLPFNSASFIYKNAFLGISQINGFPCATQVHNLSSLHDMLTSSANVLTATTTSAMRSSYFYGVWTTPNSIKTFCLQCCNKLQVTAGREGVVRACAIANEAGLMPVSETIYHRRRHHWHYCAAGCPVAVLPKC